MISGSLAHELQKERGLSAGFIGSKGAKFGDTLLSQRGLTDKAFSQFNSLSTQIDASQLGDSARERLSQSTKAMGLIADKRKAIDQLQLEGPASFSYYTATIDYLLRSAPSSSTD